MICASSTAAARSGATGLPSASAELGRRLARGRGAEDRGRQRVAIRPERHQQAILDAQRDVAERDLGRLAGPVARR